MTPSSDCLENCLLKGVSAANIVKTDVKAKLDGLQFVGRMHRLLHKGNYADRVVA